ncbi:hypothetical protein OUZ56_004085 [Daphnia magna]|uniref:Uncharacterized protein n=1 Tax=Daphnia magna TaxID=35525 RepID=A0ABQ9YNR2_9CRUS|nr:hypothetical protein OUZ56_004085 [Daphnia magna]
MILLLHCPFGARFLPMDWDVQKHRHLILMACQHMAPRYPSKIDPHPLPPGRTLKNLSIHHGQHLTPPPKTIPARFLILFLCALNISSCSDIKSSNENQRFLSSLYFMMKMPDEKE